MCPVTAESKNSNPSFKKKINKKIDPYSDKGLEEDNIIESKSPL